MALPALATLTQLESWMQAGVGTLPASASMVLDTVSAIVRAEARQNFTRSTSTVTMYPSSTRGIPARYYVDLPQRPVVSVDSVVSDGVALVADTDYELRRDRLYLNACAPVSVTFTHGYVETPGDVLAVVLTAAQRVLSNPSDLRQEAVGNVSVTYAAETIGASLAQRDKDLLQRYRRGVASVRLT